ncbi:MAG: YggT family protein [Clostridia bacterium]|nr:YggT family protein [Clostridia bacterium]
MALRGVILLMEVVLIIRVFCDFKAVRKDSVPYLFLQRISEPLLEPVRQLLTKEMRDKKLKLDLSPFVVMIVLYLINTLLKR